MKGKVKKRWGDIIETGMMHACVSKGVNKEDISDRAI